MPRNKKNNRGELQNQNYEKEYKNLQKEAIKQLSNKYVEWFDANMKNFKEFWLGNFVYPIVFPLLSLSISHYIFHFNFSREQGIILFSVFYVMVLIERLYSKYNKLVSILDKRFDEIYVINRKKKT
jgi:hypothetical protein